MNKKGLRLGLGVGLGLGLGVGIGLGVGARARGRMAHDQKRTDAGPPIPSPAAGLARGHFSFEQTQRLRKHKTGWWWSGCRRIEGTRP
jgi:hypothetical protein